MKYFISDSIENHWCMVIIISRLTFSQFYFIFVHIFLTDSISYCLHLESTVSISCPSWARIFSTCLQWQCRLGAAECHCSTHTPTGSFTIVCTGPRVLSLPIASTSRSLEERCPQAAGLDFACTQEERHPGGQTLVRTYKHHALIGQPLTVTFTISRAI